MNQEDLAYKLTADIIKKYDLTVLEEKYNTFGGKLIAKVFNEILENLVLPDNNSVIFCENISED